MKVLEDMFDACGVTIVGIQESRIRGSQTIHGDTYTMYASGCTATGSYGTQVWIHKKLGHRLHSVVDHSPRLLEVIIELAQFEHPLIVISGHAPQSHDTPETQRQFWDM